MKNMGTFLKRKQIILEFDIFAFTVVSFNCRF